MSDLLIARDGRAGRITLNRPQALNALTHEMCLAIEAALAAWRADDGVALVVIEGAGTRAFCAGGDLAGLYAAGRAGDVETPRRFWRDEYRLNAMIHAYAKPVVSFLNGFVMGGGIGVGCHGRHRIVGETTRIAMPECAIGLVPDVGGSFLLARAPGRLGEYLGLTGARMDAADAIHAGFADRFVPEAAWSALKARLCESGDIAAIDEAAAPPPPAPLAAWAGAIDAAFAGPDLPAIVAALASDDGAMAKAARALMAHNAPLSMAATLAIIRRVRQPLSFEQALALEYRFTARAMEHGDFLEGIRARIIDKDNRPRWRHASVEALQPDAVAAMLAPGPQLFDQED